VSGTLVGRMTALVLVTV